MSVAPHPEDDQQALWNGPAGRTWAEAQGLLDRFFGPIEGLLADAVSAAPRSLVLDVGCGTGATTLAAARRLGAGGRCVGVDISEPMLEVARARAEREGAPATFVRADAQTYAFEASSFDLIISRFGVMFFDDPVRAFANLRRAARDGAELRLVAWRGAEDNPFMTTAERAAAPFVPSLPARRPDAPGQFAFADRSRVQRILEGGGWADVDIRAVDIPCTLPENELVTYLTRLGPLGRVLQSVDEQTRARILDVVRPAFDPYVHGDEVRITAACWLIGGRALPGPGAQDVRSPRHAAPGPRPWPCQTGVV